MNIANMGTEALFSPSLATRYHATKAVGEMVLQEHWPLGCSGASNAFLALIGPSMGHAARGTLGAVGGHNRPQSRRPMRIGRDAMCLDWGDHRRVRWTRFCFEVLGRDEYVGSLTALLNLDWRNSSSEKDIPEDDLARGFKEWVWPLLTKIGPRIVCPLTKRVRKTMLEEIEARRVPFPPCPIPLTKDGPIVFRLEGWHFLSFFVRPHNHPSRAISYAQMAEVGKACQWFLKESEQ